LHVVVFFCGKDTTFFPNNKRKMLICQ
jgi:hypothetical protein